MFRRTSLIDISVATNVAQGGSRLKLTKRIKIDCSHLSYCKDKYIFHIDTLLHLFCIYILQIKVGCYHQLSVNFRLR